LIGWGHRRKLLAISGRTTVRAERVERRLAAILAADVAGYSRLMGEDEEGTLARLKAHRNELIDPGIAEHKGRIVKTTGDGMLVEFGSVVDAVRCAVVVQQAMAERNAVDPPDRRIEFRVGINLGDVIFDGDDLFGDGVNIAARLEGLAEPGGICISEDAFRQVRGKIEAEFADIGEQNLKNIARPLRVYRVRPDGPLPSPPPPAGEGSALGARVGAGAPPPLPDKPSIAVLPFANLSGDPEQEYFADGMVEEIITALSRIRWLFVIARNSSFTYKGQAVDVKQVGRELGVRYVLEGSVRKASGRVRHHGAADRRAEWRPSLGRPLRRLARRCLRAAGPGRGQRRRHYRTDVASRRDCPLGQPSDKRPYRLRPLSTRRCDDLAVGNANSRGASPS
jgi:adenylate cyclase